MRLTAVRVADALVAGQSAPVFMYRFDWASAQFPESGSSHGFEMPMVFDNVAKASLTNNDPVAAMLGTQMSTAWTSFARDGRPTLPAATWPAYDAQSRATLLFMQPVESVDDPEAARRRIWQDVPSLQLGFD